MAHQNAPDSLPLEFVDHGESYFGNAGAHDDVASSADDRGPARVPHHGNQDDMVGEIDVHKEIDLSFGKMPSDAEEPAVERLDAHVIDGCDNISSVLGPEGADFDAPSIAQQLKG